MYQRAIPTKNTAKLDMDQSIRMEKVFVMQMQVMVLKMAGKGGGSKEIEEGLKFRSVYEQNLTCIKVDSKRLLSC